MSMFQKLRTSKGYRGLSIIPRRLGWKYFQVLRGGYDIWITDFRLLCSSSRVSNWLFVRCGLWGLIELSMHRRHITRVFKRSRFLPPHTTELKLSIWVGSKCERPVDPVGIAFTAPAFPPTGLVVDSHPSFGYFFSKDGERDTLYEIHPQSCYAVIIFVLEPKRKLSKPLDTSRGNCQKGGKNWSFQS